MPQFSHGSVTLHYEIAGDGPPLLLVAGTASDSASWGPLPPLLPGRRLIAPDNRGSGRTRCDGALDIDDMADDLAALLDHLGLEAVDVCGHSLGGALGLRLAVRHPGRVKRLATLGTGTVDAKSLALLDDLARLYQAAVPDLFFRLLYQWLFSEPFFEHADVVDAAAAASVAYAHRQSPTDFARQVAAIRTASPIDLAAVACPVLAVCAGRDLLAPPAAVALMHAAIPELRTELLPGVGHSMHWEAPAAVASLLSAFFAEGSDQ